MFSLQFSRTSFDPSLQNQCFRSPRPVESSPRFPAGLRCPRDPSPISAASRCISPSFTLRAPRRPAPGTASLSPPPPALPSTHLMSMAALQEATQARSTGPRLDCQSWAIYLINLSGQSGGGGDESGLVRLLCGLSKFLDVKHLDLMTSVYTQPILSVRGERLSWKRQEVWV